MFESDDFDQVLSQFEFPEVKSPDFGVNKITDIRVQHVKEKPESTRPNTSEPSIAFTSNNLITTTTQQNDEFKTPEFLSPKHAKRKMINSLFDSKSKRKFPGPAGLLTGSLKDNQDESVGQMQLLSQDVDFTQNHLRSEIFESPLWARLVEDIREWTVGNVDSIQTIKQQALAGHLQRRKAQNITAFVEAIDRSATDPVVILRDKSGSIKCTLHRDAWLSFSSYIASEYCALVLRTPTVLTTGGAFKKHYLNITLSNIYAIYSSAVLKDDETNTIPDGYSMVYEEEFSVIKTTAAHNNDKGDSIMNQNGSPLETDDFLGDLDGSIFLDDIF
ncbi:hypothetical protein JYU34_001715 [Plutella xylostella]|uniref:Homologous recombination OB-fold protein OB-fold domain-containing protein n=1 Tax=Plutella xylostella TaxID=51655 RepID=A0ABQ7R4P5_PLUXY|nr:hypothetical protein JYU34_001715 [Plutella xylostella]